MYIGGLWWIFICLMYGGLCVIGGENMILLLEIFIMNVVVMMCLVLMFFLKLVFELKFVNVMVFLLCLVGYGGLWVIVVDVWFIEVIGVCIV